jgi:hypothetical protein
MEGGVDPVRQAVPGSRTALIRDDSSLSPVGVGKRGKLINCLSGTLEKVTTSPD